MDLRDVSPEVSEKEKGSGEGQMGRGARGGRGDGREARCGRRGEIFVGYAGGSTPPASSSRSAACRETKIKTRRSSIPCACMCVNACLPKDDRDIMSAIDTLFDTLTKYRHLNSTISDYDN